MTVKQNKDYFGVKEGAAPMQLTSGCPPDVKQPYLHPNCPTAATHLHEA